MGKKYQGRPKSCDNIPNGGACKKCKGKNKSICKNCTAT